MLGREAVSTFYFAIQESKRQTSDDLSRRPVELIENLRMLLGSDAFRIVEPAIVEQIRATFKIERNIQSFADAFEIAKKNFILL